MKIKDFEFATNSLNYSAIEDCICNHCEIGYADTSVGIPAVFEIGRYYNIYISAQNGNMSCHIVAYKNSESESEYKYSFQVSCVDVKRKK
ncbi:MAG: hypothetical protein IJ666_07425 [Ruminococcus sp.]|nr:hypothetical protein [Ruminococcus sp.]